MTTHAIIIGGILKDLSGRPLGPYRLRTACRNAGFNAEVIDYAWALTLDEMLLVLDSYISKETLVIGLSTVWFGKSNSNIKQEMNQWFTDEFFTEVSNRWPHVQIVIGGSKPTFVNGAISLKKQASWWLTGFADVGFVRLLEKLSGKSSNFAYTIDGDGTKICNCNTNYPVVNTDDIETVFEKTDRFLPYQPLSLEVSRGCIFKCSFCSHPFLGKKDYEYIRSPESLARELKRNYDLFGTTRYQLTDDTLNDSMEKLDRIERAIELSKIPDFEFVSYIRSELLVTTPQMIQSLKRLQCRGAFIGVESMGRSARMAIGKGMDFNRVADALATFKAETNVKLHAGMIVGLPGDTLDDCVSYGERLYNDKIFSNWRFQPLGLVHDQDRNGLSLFEQNPEKYGYTIKKWSADYGGDWTCSWEHSSGIDNKMASETANIINEKYQELVTPGGFSVAEFWFHKFSNDEIETTPVYHSKIGARSYERGILRKDTEIQFAKIRLMKKQ